MRRPLILAALFGLATFAIYRWGTTRMHRTTTGGDFEIANMTSALIIGTCVVWLVLFTWVAIGNVADMVTEALGRRAKAREDERIQRARLAREEAFLAGYGTTEIRIGNAPVRPHPAANRAA